MKHIFYAATCSILLTLMMASGCSQSGGGSNGAGPEAKSEPRDQGDKKKDGTETSTGHNPDPETTGDQGPGQSLSDQKNICDSKGSDFRWGDGACTAVPNRKIAGTLTASPGLIWEASTETCDLAHTADGDRYVNCAGVDVTIPMPTLAGAPSLNSVKMLFNCDSVATLKVSLGIGVSYYNNSWGPRADPQIYRSHVLAGETPAIHLVFAPTAADEAVGKGCKIALLENSAQAEAPPPELGDYDYRFEGMDENNQACTTGKQSFSSIQSLCVGLQSPLINKGNCALQERIAHFARKCEPVGYSFNESLRCAVGLYPGSLTIGSGEFPDQGRIAREEYCVGRRSDGFDIGRFGQHGIMMGEDVRISVEMKFFARNVSDGDHKSGFRFELTPREGQNLIADPVEIVDPVFARSSGFTRDQRFQYVAVCRKTWSCDP